MSIDRKLTIGTDIVKNKRVAELFSKYRDNFLMKFLTLEEIRRIKKSNNIQTLSGIFAAKEAVVKALHACGLTDITMHDIVIISQRHKSPVAIVKSNHSAKIHISISHEREYTIAVALCSSKSI